MAPDLGNEDMPGLVRRFFQGRQLDGLGGSSAVTTLACATWQGAGSNENGSPKPFTSRMRQQQHSRQDDPSRSLRSGRVDRRG
jgi:hypothetical protein